MTNDDERMAWLRLALADLPARVRAADLLRIGRGASSSSSSGSSSSGSVSSSSASSGAAARVLAARVETLAAHLGQARARATQRALARVKPQRVLRQAAEEGQEVVTPADPAWPSPAFQGLAEGLDDAPCALFLRGRLPAHDAVGVAVVGTRDATPYGLRAAREIAIGLAEAGVWVVSGFAVGIDGAAHEGALEAAGPTLAVLGCGIDFGYPLAHTDLKDDVAATGGLLSEHPPGTPPQKWHFPRRNRLVAALSRATVVVEAPARSGALITARLALDLGREVLAVPGSVFGPGRAGCHRLLRQGAALCEGAGDVLELLGLGAEVAQKKAPQKKAAQKEAGQTGPGPTGGGRTLRGPPASEPEALLWHLLDDSEAVDAAELCRRTGLGAAEVAAALTALELDGRARRLPGVGFLRS